MMTVWEIKDKCRMNYVKSLEQTEEWTFCTLKISTELLEYRPLILISPRCLLLTREKAVIPREKSVTPAAKQSKMS